MDSDGPRPSCCGGHDAAEKSLRPLSTKMCVASFLTKSGSSTPATWVLVVVHADGLLDEGPLLAGPAPVEGPPLATPTPPPPHRRRHMICASSWWRICATAASCTAF